MITIESEQQPGISGGALAGTYEFTQLEFHLRRMDTKNLTDGKRCCQINNFNQFKCTFPIFYSIFIEFSYPMELHMFFYNKDYQNIGSGTDSAEELIVLAFVYHVRIERTIM